MSKDSGKRLAITFDDLPLLEAIFTFCSRADYLRSEIPLISDEGREMTLQKIISLLPNEKIGEYRFEFILLHVNQYRKLGAEAKQKRHIILEHARKMTVAQCFYRDKLGTPCSEFVDLDRVKPGKRGGLYTVENTVLSCSKHNRSRGCKEVEAFWRQ